MDAIKFFFSEYGKEILIPILSLIAGNLLGRWQSWREWSSRSFMERVTVSLNFIENDELKIRTLLERTSTEVFRNPEMIRTITRASQTNDQHPILDLPEEEYWYYLNAVLNVISERFAEGFVRQEAGMAVQANTYLMFLTSETSGPVRQRKIRTMLIREDLLLQAKTLTPEFKNEFHANRWASLGMVAEEWERTEKKSHRIREIALCV